MAIVGRLKQSIAATVVLGPFVDATDGVTAETALTISQADVRLSKNAGTFAQVNESTSASHMENGYYSKALNTTDTNTLGRLTICVNESGALPIRQEYEILAAHEWDALFTATGNMARGIVTYGTAQSATSTTLVLASAEGIPNDTVNGCTLVAYDSTNGYQVRTIIDYVFSTDMATVDTWTATPTGTISYWVFAGAPASATVLPSVNMTQIAGQTASASGTVTFPNATLASTTNITAGTITTVTNLTNAPTSGDLTSTMKASVNAEVVDVLRTDTVAELSAVPAANAPLSAKIGWLFMKARNAITQTATTQAVKADDGTTNVATATVSDDGTTATRGEFS